ncbi:hypothetical protein [uncultured Clostridium sp.]|uniref:hypothetical protein n=1 Tax=uncultured Clostridium sp. TaxID=59620 RepID=UPI0028EB159E|nr:hypothetical protein [uncultured Clostridium sp.]
MEYKEEENYPKMNIEAFSKMISENWDIDEEIITNYILANISLSLTRSSEMKREIDKIYMSDELKYYNAAKKSPCINYSIIMQGTLEQEIQARRVLGILVEAEFDNNVRSKVIKLLRKYYPVIFNSVKKKNNEKLKNKYMKMDIITRNVEARFDAAIYLYFSIHVSPESVDQGFIISILEDIESFEFGNIINQNIEAELERYKVQIQEIKALLKREYGRTFNYKDIIRHNNEEIRNSGEFLEDLFLNNKLSINHLFKDFEFINIDKIILSYVRISKNKDPEIIVHNIINGIFVQSLLNEYQKVRKLYIEKNGEELNFKLKELEQRLNRVEIENSSLKSKLEELNEEKASYDKNLAYEINKLDNAHKLEIKVMEERLKNLENKLNEEKNLRAELESLREYELNLSDDSENLDLNKNLEDYIENKKIIIIGGDKEWRRRFRIKYPQIRTLNGFNENFDINALNNADYIFFYTKYMNHSTFHKAMNYIKFNQCNFGYIGKTNMELVEQEIIDKISKST